MTSEQDVVALRLTVELKSVRRVSLDVRNRQENTATGTRWHLINGNRSGEALGIRLAALHLSKGKELQGHPAKYG